MWRENFRGGSVSLVKWPVPAKAEFTGRRIGDAEMPPDFRHPAIPAQRWAVGPRATQEPVLLEESSLFEERGGGSET